MGYRMLLINIIFLCLAMLVRRTVQVQHLKTGYIYPVGDKGNGREKDLKCAFWHSGITHLQLTKLLLNSDGLVPSTFNAITGFVDNTQIQLAVLYKLKSERIGALWLVHLYVSQASSHYEYLIKDSRNTDEKIIDKLTSIHDYITGKLESETLVHCAEGNRFDWRKKSFAAKKLTSDEVQATIEQNTGDMNKILITNNNNNKLMAAAVDNLTDFKAFNILLLHIGVKRSIFNIMYMVYRFNYNVAWKYTRRIFTREWCQARDVDFASNGLDHVKIYLTLLVDILKVTVMRSTWKYLTYLKHATFERRPAHAANWLSRLQDFAAIVDLHEDKHVRHLLGALGDERIQNMDFIDLLINYIIDELTTLSAPLGCEATKPFLPLNRLIPDYNPENPAHIEKLLSTDGVFKAIAFNVFLREKIIQHDFGITRALLSYIDEPKSYVLFKN